jgi:alkanesulfonate monooxygenase SsuD/methylene tetrahydromethanopterin reductase-like flavin-dependent oxidoreductase (luciferase family)
MTVDLMSAGRLELGMGSAGTHAHFAMTGVGPWEPRERYERLVESVTIVDALLRVNRL